MKNKLIGSLCCLSLALGASGTAWAQPAGVPFGDPADGNAAAQVTVSEEEMVLGAVELPIAANRARAAGIAEDDVRDVLRSMNRHRMRAWEAREVMVAAAESAGRHGPCDNFGAFVNARLDEGLRGQDLAQAIRDEHLARGRGHRGQGFGSGERPGLRGRLHPELSGPGRGLRPDVSEGSGRGRERGVRGLPMRDGDQGRGRPERGRRPMQRRVGPEEEGSGRDGRRAGPGGGY